MINNCQTCKYKMLDVKERPCAACYPEKDKWAPVDKSGKGTQKQKHMKVKIMSLKKCKKCEYHDQYDKESKQVTCQLIKKGVVAVFHFKKNRVPCCPHEALDAYYEFRKIKQFTN